MRAMIRAATGIGQESSASASARTAVLQAMSHLRSDGASRADVVLLFLSGEADPSIGEAVKAAHGACDGARLVGCSAAGILSEGAEIEGETAAVALAIESGAMQAHPVFMEGLKGNDRAIGQQIGRMVRPHLDDNPLLVLFPDTLSCNPEPLFEGLHDISGPIPVVGGGAAAGGPRPDSTWQFCDGGASTNAVSGLILTGAIVCSVGVTHSCLPIGRPMKVTSGLGNSIRALDGIPAIEALAGSIPGAGRDVGRDLHRIAPHIFVVFPAGPGREVRRGQYFVRSILGVDPSDGAIFVGREVHEGETISFALRDPEGAREDLKAMLEESLPLAGSPDLALYFNCCARGQGLYGLQGIDTAYIRNAFSEIPIAGFFGFAEIAPLRGRARLHNYSGVMALVSEAPSSDRGNGIPPGN